MKPQALRSSLQPLGLSIMAKHSIIAAGEGRTGRQQYAPFEPVPNDALECRPVLRANERDAGCRAESVDRAMPRLLATGFRIDLSSRPFSDRRPRFNAGFLCHAT